MERFATARSAAGQPPPHHEGLSRPLPLDGRANGTAVESPQAKHRRYADLGVASVGGEACRSRILRSGGHLPKGEQGVRLESQVADGRVLLSDFDLWHYVLNYWYLPETTKVGKAFEKKLAEAGLSFYKCDHQHPLPHARFRREIERSWERIFDVEWADRKHAIAEPSQRKSIQATLWELSIDDVVRAKEFTAR